jgi:hypothetical protein
VATLNAKTGDVDLILRPYRLAEEGEPTWLATQLEVKQEGRTIFSTTLSLTSGDFEELGSGLVSVAIGKTKTFALTTMDDDLVIEMGKGELEGDVFVGFWAGEPYGLMTGYRFITLAGSLKAFADELLDERANLLPLAHRR